MSKIPKEKINGAISDIYEYSTTTKKRNFVESVEIQISLKNYDPNKSKRLNGLLVLPHVPRKNFTVCIIADQKDKGKAELVNVPTRTQEELKLLKKNQKLVKKLTQEYDAFLASKSLLRRLTRIVGSGFSKAGKFPTALNPDDNIEAKIETLAKTAKFTLKSKATLCVCMAIGNVDMTPAQTTENVNAAINFMVSLLPRNWQQIKRIYVKSTMGPSHRIFGA